MTIHADLPPVEDAAPLKPRRQWSRRMIIGTIAVTALLLALIGTGIAWLVYANAYQPLSPGSFGSNGGLHAVVVTDGVEDTRAVVMGPRGTVARFELSIANQGSHDVRLLGLGYTSGRFSAKWGPEFGPGNLIGGLPSQARPFPVTLKAHHELTLWLFATKPACSPSGAEEWTQLPISWSALGVRHVYELPMTGRFLPIDLCVPNPGKLNLDRGF